MAGKEKAERCRAILGVKEDATLRDLRRAFRRKAAALHPDVNPGDPVATEAFKKVTAAYEYLKTQVRVERHAPGRETGMTEAPPASRRRPAEPAGEQPQQPRPLPMEELVLRLKHSQNPYVRLHAVRAIEQVGGREGAWAMVQALEDASRIVVEESVRSLGNLKARIASMPLIHLHKRSSYDMRIRVENALEKINSPMCRKYLKQIGKMPPEPEPERAAAADDTHIA